MPFIPFPESVLDYSLYTAGYHFGNLILHVFVDERERSFEEYLLHHIVACSLFVGYVLPNVMAIGTVAAWIHDVPDIFASWIKLSNATCIPEIYIVVSFLTMMTVWFIFRLVFLPHLIHNIWWFTIYADEAMSPMPDRLGIGITNFVFLMVM